MCFKIKKINLSENKRLISDQQKFSSFYYGFRHMLYQIIYNNYLLYELDKYFYLLVLKNCYDIFDNLLIYLILISNLHQA